MKKSQLFEDALRNENWDEAKRIVHLFPEEVDPTIDMCAVVSSLDLELFDLALHLPPVLEEWESQIKRGQNAPMT